MAVAMTASKLTLRAQNRATLARSREDWHSPRRFLEGDATTFAIQFASA
jgi:hypothetical protein